MIQIISNKGYSAGSMVSNVIVTYIHEFICTLSSFVLS